MVRPARPEVRAQLIERTAGMLARREPVTLRGVVAGTRLSTMAVYTYFGGMPELLGAVRQEGFVRLAARLRGVDRTDDPVRDLAAVQWAYAQAAVQTPDLYVVMFDGSLPLPDPTAADDTFGELIAAVARAVEAGRLAAGTDPVGLANEIWMLGHGACMLVATGVLTFAQVEPVVLSGSVRLYVGAGDDETTARASVAAGWSG